MTKFRRSMFSFAAAPLVAGVVGCSGADNPQIVKAPPPPKPTAEELKPAPSSSKHMQNSRYQEAMKKMEAAQGR